jgi:hypothetical protein
MVIVSIISIKAIMHIMGIIAIILIISFQVGWKSVCLLVLSELTYTEPILSIIPIESILGILELVPVNDTCMILQHLHNLFPERQVTAGRVPVTGSGWCLSTCGYLDGPALQYVVKASGDEGT